MNEDKTGEIYVNLHELHLPTSSLTWFLCVIWIIQGGCIQGSPSICIGNDLNVLQPKSMARGSLEREVDHILDDDGRTLGQPPRSSNSGLDLTHLHRGLQAHQLKQTIFEEHEVTYAPLTSMRPSPMSCTLDCSCIFSFEFIRGS